MKTPDALINPELLVWARESAGYEQADAATKLGITVERLIEWENGESHPSIAQLRKASEVFRRPLAAFFLPHPPKDFTVPRDYRRAVGTQPRKMSPQLLFGIRRVQFQREVAIGLAELPQQPTFLGMATLNTPIEQLALEVRGMLGITLNQQSAWQTKYEAFNAWRAALESLGILVVQVDQVDVAEFRGFSVQAAVFPIIALNAKDHPHAKIFTCLHEFGHLLLSEGGLCDLDEDALPVSSPDSKTEQFCNAFAGSVLVPRTNLLTQATVRGFGSRSIYPDEAIEELANTFRVSREVIVRRLMSCDLVPREFYLRKRAEYAAEFQKLLESTKPTGFISPTLRVFRTAGPEFTRLVLEAYDRQAITGADLSAYLGTRIKNVGPLRELAFADAHLVEVG